jgi:hypothetical protein
VLAFGTVITLVYRVLYTNGTQSLSGFVLAGLWILIACLFHI